MPRYPSALPTKAIRAHRTKCRKSWQQLISELGVLTRFERQYFYKGTTGVGQFRRYTPIIDHDRIVGYFRKSGSYQEVRDREGRVAWSDEASVQSPLISPVDIFGPGAVKAGYAAVKSVGRVVSRGVQRAVTIVTTRSVAMAGQSARLLQRALVKLRAVAARLRAAVASLFSAGHRAKELVKTLKSEGKEIVVNVGGEAASHEAKSWPHAINVNPAPRMPNVPNLIKQSGENLARLFTANTVDKVVASKIPTSVDPVRLAEGAAAVLKKGGQLQINVFGSGVQQWGDRFVKALVKHGFDRESIRSVAGVLFEAVK